MQCHDFERIWNEQLDAREGASAEVDRALDAHAAACPACRLIAARYQTLRNVVRTLSPPLPPAGFVDRFFDRREQTRARPVIARLGVALVPLAAAASLLLAAYLGWPPARGPAPNVAAPAPPAKAIDPESLSDALAHAGSATWELALETSAPAARVGREVLGSASFGRGTAPLPLTVPAPPADVLQSVGDRVNAGVRPLSGTARHAFGFLLGSPPEDSSTPSAPSTGA